LLAEVLAHSGDIRIAIGRPFEPDPALVATALGFLTGPLPIGLVPLRRLRGIRLRATDIDYAWGEGREVRGRGSDLLMAAVGRTPVFDSLEGRTRPTNAAPAKSLTVGVHAEPPRRPCRVRARLLSQLE
jgi:hypothetical protein